MIIMPTWIRNTLCALMLAMVGYSVSVTVAYVMSNRVESNYAPPTAVFVSTVDPMCAAMSEVDRALCSIAVDRPPYGTEESDGAVTWTPDGRTLVLDCVGYTGEELSLCLLSAAREPVGVLPECPSGELKYALITCVYLDANDTPTVWRVK